MGSRRPHEPGAGPWVAYLNDGRVKYVRRCDADAPRVQEWAADVADALRFDTKPEALEAVRRGRRRVSGVTTGAHKSAAAQTTGAGSRG